MGFYTWILDANLSGNVMDEITYSSDSQRQSGFQSGTVASSIRVNTALRQSTLVTAALMESMNLGTFSYENSLPDIKSAIDTFFAGLEVTPNPDMTGQTPIALNGLKIRSGYYTVSGGTTVVANPTLSGTEADLGSLTVGGTKYKVFKQVSGTFKYSLGGVEVSGGKYILQGNKLSLYFNGNFSSYAAVSGTQLTLIDESNNWNKFNTSDSQNKMLIGVAGTGTTMYFGSATITHSSLSPYIVFAFNNVKTMAGSSIGDGTFSGYYMQYFVNIVVDFIL